MKRSRNCLNGVKFEVHEQSELEIQGVPMFYIQRC